MPPHRAADQHALAPPVRKSWQTVAWAGATAVGTSLAAAWVTTRPGIDPQVGVAAWVAASVIGTTALIVAGVIEGPRPRRLPHGQAEEERPAEEQGN